MDGRLILYNLLSAPVLFFALGMVATWLRSDLDIPNPISKFLSLYLLFAIGLKGGAELAESGLNAHIMLVMLACVAMASAVPVWTFLIMRLRLDTANAAAVAATYGSISAVTFIIATSVLAKEGIAFGGHLVAAMALMESPAIVMAVILAQLAGDRSIAARPPWGHVLSEAFLNGAVVLLMGSLIIGAVIGRKGFHDLAPFVESPFKGVLCLFLLDLGLIASRRLGDLRRGGPVLIAFAVIAPAIHALIGIAIARALRMSVGDALLFAVLCGSASYIAVPAAARLVLPAANPGLFVPMSLAITFPFNVTVGIPLYLAIIRAWFGEPS